MKPQFIETIFQFFIENNFSKNYTGNDLFVSKYQKLHTLYKNFEGNVFISESIIYTLYSYAKNEKYTFQMLEKTKDFLPFIVNYELFCQEYLDKNRQILSELKKYVFSNGFEYFKHPEEVIPYLIVEALTELDNAKISFISKVNVSEAESHQANIYLHSEIIPYTTFNETINILRNKPNGYFLCEDLPQTHSNIVKGNGYMLAANNDDGILIYQFKNEVAHRSGLRGTSLRFDNILRKEHKIDFETNESASNQVSVDVKEFDFPFYNFINECVFKTFIYISSTEANNHKKDCKAYIGFQKEESKNNQFPVLSDYQSHKMPIFTFDDLRFTGKFEFLSFLDDYLEEFLDMDLVNYYSDDIRSYHELSFTHFKNDHVFERTRESFNSFKIIIKDELSMGDDRSNMSLTPINPYFFGTEKEIYDYAFKIAKANKLKLYSLYVYVLDLITRKSITNEVQAFFNNNINTLIDDNVFVSMLKSVGTANISDRNKDYLFNARSHAFPAVIHDKQFVFGYIFDKSKVAENEIAFDTTALSDIPFLDYQGKVKAKKMVVTHCHDMTMYQYLRDNYNYVLSADHEFFINITKAYIELKKIVNHDVPEGTKLHNLTMMYDSKFEAEYYSWLDFYVPFFLAIPMSDKNEKEFIKRCKLNNSEIINCTFGYSNGSKEYSIPYLRFANDHWTFSW